MAHLITDGMISYSGETPWHGLGERVNPNATPEQMLEAAKMNWSVELRSLAVSTNTAITNDQGDVQKVWRAAPMNDYKAVMRMDTQECFGVVSKRYKPVQNLEVARFFHEYTDSTACQLEVVGALQGGRKIWALARVNADYVVTSKDHGSNRNGEDLQLGYVMLATSHDGSLRTIAMGTSIYVVCWNTMSAALSEAGGTGKQNKNVFSLKHTARFDATAKREAIKTVGLVKEQLQATHEMAETFAAMRMDGRGRIEFIRRLLGGESIIEQIANDEQLDTQRGSLLDQIVQDEDKKKPEETRLGKSLLDAIINSPGNDGPTRQDTMWGAINGVTWYSDHSRGRTDDATLNASWFGQGATMKAKAVDVAYDMSGASRRAVA